jgi:hypothetical protein
MAAAERLASAELDGHEDELRSALDGMRSGFASTLANLHTWRVTHEAKAATARLRFEAEAAVAQHAELAAAVPHGVRAPCADPVGEELDTARVQRVRAMLDHSALPARAEPPPFAATGGEGVVGSVVAAKLDAMGAVPPGIDVGDADVALQRRLERELMAKYGLSDDDQAQTRMHTENASRESAAIQVQLGKYAAGLESVLSE